MFIKKNQKPKPLTPAQQLQAALPVEFQKMKLDATSLTLIAASYNDLAFEDLRSGHQPRLIQMIEGRVKVAMNDLHILPTFALQWQKQRLVKFFLFLFGAIALSFAFPDKRWQILGGGVVIATLFYINTGRQVIKSYDAFRFKRQLQWLSFAQNLVPYMDKIANGGSFVVVLSRLLSRMDSPVDRALTQRLITDITKDSRSIEPYLTFARNFTPMQSALVFMQSVYNIQQTSNPTDSQQVITDLSERANREMIIISREIREYKIKKFAYNSTKITMIVIVGMLGEIGGLVVAQVMELAKTMHINF